MEAFRHYLQGLEERKELLRFAYPLSVQYETAAVMQKLEKETMITGSTCWWVIYKESKSTPKKDFK